MLWLSQSSTQEVHSIAFIEISVSGDHIMVGALISVFILMIGLTAFLAYWLHIILIQCILYVYQLIGSLLNVKVIIGFPDFLA